ncbi:VOC family protein [Kribbella sp. NBC_01505]|uniref:VOC family protein n=1 Tax=Kribbella sp. NBC_01505 TaxID=2903580 RepID=UPI00386C7D43
MVAAVHHVEIWVPELTRARQSWGWVLNRLGWKDGDGWPGGMTWIADDGSYVVVEQSPAMSADVHDRLRPGMNHLALNVASRAELDALVAEAAGNGWTLMFADRHPYAGGPQHYAAFLHNEDGYELELVAPN